MQNLVALPAVEVEIMSSKQRSTGAAVFERQGLKRPGSGGCAIKPWTYMCKQYKPPGLKGLMKDVAQTLQQRPWSGTIAPNWQASKHKLHKHQRKTTSSNGFQWFTENKNCVKFVVGSEIKTRRKVNGL